MASVSAGLKRHAAADDVEPTSAPAKKTVKTNSGNAALVQDHTDNNVTNDNDAAADHKDVAPAAQLNVIEPTVSVTVSEVDNAAVVREHVGDLFAAPENSLLIHACNTEGSWGAGIAKEFRKRYPRAYRAYEEHCLVDHYPRTNPVPTGTCLLIPPSNRPGDPKHWIGCLFTSKKYGRGKDSPAQILVNTAHAFGRLLVEIGHQAHITEVRMCRINSGLFEVEWEDTKGVLEDVMSRAEVTHDIHVYSPASPKPENTLHSFLRRP